MGEEEQQLLWTYQRPSWPGRFLDGWCTRATRSTYIPEEYPRNELLDLVDLESATRSRALWLLPSRILHPDAVALIEQAIPPERILDLRFSSEDGTHADASVEGRFNLALQLIDACEEHLASE